MRLRFVAMPFLLLVPLLFSASQLSAQYLPNLGGDGISVYGTGEVLGRPNVVELDLQVSGKAELTGDALVKYRDAKKRLLEALDKVKVDGMSLDERGVTIAIGNTLEQQQRLNNGMPQVPGKPQVDVSSAVRVKLKGVRDVPAEELIKTVGKLLDTASDSGVTIGPNQAELLRAMRFGQQTPNNAPVRFVVADLAELREKAYEKAVADARSRAQRLAKLHHVKLGSAVLIQEVQVSGDQPAAIAYQGNQLGTPEYDGDEPRMTSGSLTGVSVQVKLLVRFAIEAAGPATAQQ